MQRLSVPADEALYIVSSYLVCKIDFIMYGCSSTHQIYTRVVVISSITKEEDCVNTITNPVCPPTSISGGG
jgi:hypothetical protein